MFGKDEPGRELVQITNQILEQAIAACGPGKHFKDIGKIIHSLLRDIDYYSVSSQFTGHGIGKKFHSPPWIFHHCMYISSS
jgi:methionyl aminopeptidase